ncbi:MAG: LON peptidase substrate-binding domain-containing protein [Acidobacteriota bacterium]|nr:LON peptidase substrate-binding domain-containing protein [Acidobacteriota bacterium]
MTHVHAKRLLCVLLLVGLPSGFGFARAQSTVTRGYAPTTIPATIPIFPLQDVMLFPRATRPLHIFEQRYRDMVADALDGDRLIGMVLLEPGYEDNYEGRPPVYPIGCVGVIADVEELPDGRYNIVLGGLTKFRITGEDNSRAYRLAHIEPISDAISASDRARLQDVREELAALIPVGIPGLRVPDGLADEDLVNGVSQLIDIAPLDRLGLLEQPGPLARAEALIDLMYIRAALPR